MIVVHTVHAATASTISFLWKYNVSCITALEKLNALLQSTYSVKYGSNEYNTLHCILEELFKKVLF